MIIGIDMGASAVKRAAPDHSRGAAELGEHSEGLDLAAEGLISVGDKVPAGAEVRVLQALGCRVDLGAGHPGFTHDALGIFGVALFKPSAYFKVQGHAAGAVYCFAGASGLPVWIVVFIQAYGPEEA